MDKEESIRRGWYLDEVMAIGHEEAKLTHTDEDVVNAYVDMENLDDSLEELQKLAESLNTVREDAHNTYDIRSKLCADLFAHFPNADTKKICKVKHTAATYILVSEIYHARGFDPKAEELLVMAGKNLAEVLSEALGVDKVACIRCLNDALHNTKPAESSEEETI